MSLEDIDFSGNPNQRTPCILVLDNSGSMDGEPIDELNNGIEELNRTLRLDPHALTHVQLSIVTAGGDSAELLLDWVDATEFTPMRLPAAGTTPLSAALILALDRIEDLKKTYRANGIQYSRPWLFCITDGEASDTNLWGEAVKRCREAEAGKKAVIYPIAVTGANIEKLGQISNNSVAQLQGLSFTNFFVWLSGSLSRASKVAPGTDVQLPPTNGWGVVRT